MVKTTLFISNFSISSRTLGISLSLEFSIFPTDKTVPVFSENIEIKLIKC